MNAPRIDLHLFEQIAAELAPYRDDETFYLDNFEGATDALEMIDMLQAAEQQDRASMEAISNHMATLKMRADRFKMRAETARRLQHKIMQAMQIRKLERPLATLSIRAGSVSVEITDERSIPTQLRKPGAPDKTAIRAQIEAGENVPGAELVRGEDTLSVRIK